jgi:membrane-associated protein
MHLFLSIFDIEQWIRYGGLVVMFLVVYGTTGIFFCFFLPSGAVLFTAGIFVASGDLKYDAFFVCFILTIASVLGNLTGYWFGWKTGPLLFKRKDSRFFKQQHLKTAEAFYNKHGWLALTMGLFLPVIRTFSPIMAGVIRLKFPRFLALVSAGSVLWICGFVAAGYFIGSRPELKPYLKYIVIVFLLGVTVPLVIWTRKELKRLSKSSKSSN